MKRALFILTVLWLSGVAHGRNLVVALDSSGTMRTYGQWQPDAVQVIQAVLSGGTFAPDSWNVTGDSNVLKDYALRRGETLYFLPFGSIAEHQWPFFSGFTKLGSPADLKTVFPNDPNAFKQQKTNKSLAIAVAGSASGKNDYSADLIVVSDFLIDAQMTATEIAYVNDFEAASTSATPLILSWKKDPRLQIKFIRIRPLSPTVDTTQDPIPSAVVHLVSAARSSNPDALRLRWRTDGNAEIRNYSVYVRDQKGRTIFSAARLLGTSASYPKPASGTLSWFVIANLMDGTELKSAVGQVVVPPSSSGGAIFVLLLLLGAGGFIAYQWWRRRGIRQEANEHRTHAAGDV